MRIGINHILESNHKIYFLLGSTNFRKTSVTDHLKSLVHETASCHKASDHTKNQAKSCFNDRKKRKIDGPIEKALNAMSTIEKDHMGKIFRAAYYLVKSNQVFKKFPLEGLEGIKFMESYKNNKSVREVIINTTEEIENENLEKVTHCYFVSFLCDGSTDLSTTEKELMHIIVDPDMHEVQLKFFFLRNAISQTFLRRFNGNIS